MFSGKFFINFLNKLKVGPYLTIRMLLGRRHPDLAQELENKDDQCSLPGDLRHFQEPPESANKITSTKKNKVDSHFNTINIKKFFENYFYNSDPLNPWFCGFTSQMCMKIENTSLSEKFNFLTRARFTIVYIFATIFYFFLRKHQQRYEGVCYKFRREKDLSRSRSLFKML